MNLKKIALLVFLLVVNVKVFGQSKKVADRYFDEFSYVESAKIYKDLIIKKGDSSKHVLSRLADSYYNNADTEEAELWYKKLISNYNKEIDNRYLFKYAQVLRSNGKYKKSDSIFSVLALQDDTNNRDIELKNENYLLDYSSKNEERIGIRNLAINTEYSDFGGFLLNGKVYYTSSTPTSLKKEKLYKWNNQPFLNLFKADEEIQTLEESVLDTVLTLVNPRVLKAALNSEYHESTPVFTKDGKTIYFTRNNSDGKKAKKSKKNTSNLKIYKASFVNGYWVNVKELPFNSDEYSVGHPALSPDEKTLYFVSNMPGGIGSTDIYKVDIKGKNDYGTPVNLGETINTSDKEMFPYIGKDSTLYFSSNGHLGLGLLDIFQSKIKEDSIYSKPKNLGYPFNSRRDDFSFFIDEKGKKGFFSSNRLKGKGDDDIYSFFMYTDPPICTQTIAGIITNKVTKEPIDVAIVRLVDINNEVIQEAVTDESGGYKFENVPCDSKFTVSASKLDHRPDKKLTRTSLKSKETKRTDLALVPLIIGNQIVIKPIYFDYDKSFIRDDAQYELENIVTVMSNHPELVIKIESHTDSRGPNDYNRALSDKRAKSTRDFILSRGIAADRIESAVGYGESQLLNDCNDANQKKCTEEEHQLNRRSYFYIVKGSENIRIRQELEKKKVKRRVSKRNNFLDYLRKNFKKSRTASTKCIEGEEDCNKDSKKFKIDYKN